MRAINRMLRNRQLVQKRRAVSWSIASLFTGGVSGLWLDPSDLTTMFQDSAGTTPVTAVEQPVGLIRDKSGRNNHAFQSTSDNRPTLSARYNLLTKTEQFADAAWTLQNNSGVATRSGNNITFGTSTFDAVYQFGKVFSAGTSYKAVVKLSGTGAVRLLLSGGNGAIIATTNITLTSTPTDYELISTSGTSGSGGGIGIYGAGSAASFTAYTADLRVTNQSNLPYQRVNTATDYDSDATKFPWYLKFNGTSSSLQTVSINFTATDKMFVSAGVRKIDSNTRMVAELSANLNFNNGSFYLLAGNNPTDGWWYSSKGNTPQAVSAATSAISTNVVSSISKLSATSEIAVRVNGAQVAANNLAQGGGTYDNYQLYIGARAGTSLFFNGYLYQLVIAGKQASTEEIDSTENYIELKTFGKDMSYVYDYLVDSTGNQITDSAGNPIYVTATYQ